MGLGTLTAFLGSGRPDVDLLRRSFDRVVEVLQPKQQALCDPFHDDPFAQAPCCWLLGDPVRAYLSFLDLLQQGSPQDSILTVCGGVGAARVGYHWHLADKPSAPRALPVVCGAGDSALYGLMNWLWGGLSYYTPNMVEILERGLYPEEIRHTFQLVPIEKETLAPLYFPNVHVFGSTKTERYRVLPFSTQLLGQLRGELYEALCMVLLNEGPFLLLLEDQYDSHSGAALAFHNNLTALLEVFSCLSHGNGALGLAGVPLAPKSRLGLNILTDMIATHQIAVPVFYGMCFGSVEGPALVIPYGDLWEFAYAPNEHVLQVLPAS